MAGCNVKRFHQFADGDIHCYLQPDTPHCGANTSTIPIPLTLTAAVHIEYGYPGCLDDNGFLIDNSWFRTYFDSFHTTALSISCENFAHQIRRWLWVPAFKAV